MNFDDDKPMGYWGRKHIANDPRWTKYYVSGSLSPRLSAAEPGFPKLEPAFMAAGKHYYAPLDVDRFFEELDAWVGGAPARAAARKGAWSAAGPCCCRRPGCSTPMCCGQAGPSM